MTKFIKSLIILTIIVGNLFAQQKQEFSRRPKPDINIRNLKVGDKVPEILISKVIRDVTPSARISDFKNQLLILDFFDTFCGSCIEALPKLDSLQKRFGKKIKILPVSYQSENVMKTFFDSNKFLLNKNVKLPCVVEDKLLGSYFQYKLVSHEVWIYNGKIIAITGTDYITAQNIQDILDGKIVNWPIKNDIVDFDPRKPIFVQTEADQYFLKSGFLQYSGITGHREGIDYKKGIVTDTLAIGFRTSFYNKSIVSTFTVITNLIKRRNFIPHPDRLILEVKDKSKYIYERGKIFPSDWRRENEICYEFVSTKLMTDKDRLNYIYLDLQNILGVNARWEKRPVKCLVIVKKNEVNFESINSQRKGQKILISAIPVFYFDQTEQFPPAIDETGLSKSIIVEDGFKNIDDFQKQLNLYGLDLIEAERVIDVLIITENGYNK